MAAFSTMFCANWQLEPMRTLCLFLAASLTLSACAPSGGEDEADAPKAPFGYELAAANPDDGKALLSARGSAGIIDLDVAQLKMRIARGNVRLIDVRTAEEVADGRIPGAEHIALDDFDPARLDLGDGREVILYCRSGRRSGIAGERLAKHTGKPAHHLAGGINAWRETGGPTE